MKKRDKKEMADKFKAGFGIYNRWLALRQRGENLVPFFEDNYLQNIAVYGIGELGERLIDELSGTDIRIVYGLDRLAENKKYAGMDIYLPDIPDIPFADAVCVTPVQAYAEIEEELAKRTQIPVISLEDVVNYCYEKSCNIDMV